MHPIDHLQASSIHLKAHSCYYPFSLSKTARLPPFLGYYGRPTRSAKSFSRNGPIEVSTADVPTPLPDKEHTLFGKEEKKRNMLKNRRGSIFLRFRCIAYNVGSPLMMNHGAQRNAIPCCLSICGHMHLENQVGALPDQLNVCLLTNISIISQFVFEEVSFGLMIGVLFSFKSGLLLVRHKAATQIIV